MTTPEQSAGRHFALVEVTQAAFGLLFTPNERDAPVCLVGLPEGARFVSVHFDFRRDVWVIRYEHESFPATAEGEAFPVIDVWYRLGSAATERA